MPNKYSEALLSAIDILAKKRVSEAEYDKTIIAEVVASKGNGSYLLKYEGAFIEAFSKDNITPHTMVYVLVPRGKMGEEKQIIGTVSFYLKQQAKQSRSVDNSQVVLWENTKGVIIKENKIIGFIDQNDQQIYF